jgi:glycosyltransferase involved in cell wall biosynthesis
LVRKILSIGHSYIVGVNRRLVNEMSRISTGKWEVQAIAPSKLNNDFRHFEYRREPTDICTISALPVYLDTSTHTMCYDWRIAEILNSDWDIVHCWQEPYIVCGAQVAYLTTSRAKLVYYSPQNIDKQYPPPFGWMERYATNRMDGLIGVGETATEMWQHKLGKKLQDKPVTTIPHGIDIDLFKPSSSGREKIHALCNWQDDISPVIGYLGRLTPEKGLPLMMNVLDRLASQGNKWRALIVGKGPMLGELQQWAQNYPDRVRIFDNVGHDAVPDYLNAMDLLLAPSQTRPNCSHQLGRMIIEAMACGVPVIASNSGEIPFVVGDAGIIVAEDDLDAWVRAIQNAIDSPTLRAELIAAGLDRVHTKFTWNIVANQKIAFFESLL